MAFPPCGHQCRVPKKRNRDISGWLVLGSKEDLSKSAASITEAFRFSPVVVKGKRTSGLKIAAAAFQSSYGDLEWKAAMQF